MTNEQEARVEALKLALSLRFPNYETTKERATEFAAWIINGESATGWKAVAGPSTAGKAPAAQPAKTASKGPAKEPGESSDQPKGKEDGRPSTRFSATPVG